MTCERIDTPDGPFFLCWSGKPPKDKPAKCSVCKKRTSTRLCDGPLETPVQRVADPTGGHPGRLFPIRAQVTCDAPLCERCTTEAAPLIALPDESALGLSMLKLTRRKNQRRDLGTKRKSVTPEPDTRDFCPDCVRRMESPKQQHLPLGGTP